jgi:hypothetical protein
MDGVTQSYNNDVVALYVHRKCTVPTVLSTWSSHLFDYLEGLSPSLLPSFNLAGLRPHASQIFNGNWQKRYWTLLYIMEP